MSPMAPKMARDLKRVLWTKGNRSSVAYPLGTASKALPIRRFIVFSSARSGSTFLINLIGHHRDVDVDYELFDHPRRWPARYLDGRATLAFLLGARAWGFKLTFAQLRWFEDSFGPGHSFLERLRHQGYVVIFLDRRSHFLQALSHMHIEAVSAGRSEKKGHFNRGERFVFEPFVADPVEVIARLHWLEDFGSWAHAAIDGLAHVRLSYEDDIEPQEQHQATADKIFAALELPSVRVESPLVAVAPPTARERVKNYAELAEVLSGTRYAAVLDR